MKIEEPKKVNREAKKWEDHMAKKKAGAAKGGDTEIIPGKKRAAEPAKTAQKTAAKGPMKGEMKIEAHAHGHGGHDHSHEGHGHAKAVKKEDKDEAKKEAGAAAKKGEKAEKKEKAPKKSRKVILKKSDAVKELSAKVLAQNGLPVFRGRFGKRNIRRKSKAKWNVWRVPRGIDVKKVMSDGYMPRIGFSTPREIRGLHPSGYRETPVRAIAELADVPKGNAVRIYGNLGRRKKAALVGKAIENGVKVLNP